jgi:hypothetical protein
MLKEDGTIAQIRAYVVDSNTNTPEIVIPGEIKLEFSNSDKWPTVRYHGIIQIILGVEDRDIQPQFLEVRKKL